MIIFQPDRILTRTQIKKYAHYVKGDVLNIGAGPFDRYSDLFCFSKYIKLDPCPDNNPDIIDRLDLYKNFLGKILSPFISAFGRLMLWLDRLDKSKAGMRQSMGWCVVAVKK